jgi:hypothetical protein
LSERSGIRGTEVLVFLLNDPAKKLTRDTDTVNALEELVLLLGNELIETFRSRLLHALEAHLQVHLEHATRSAR